MNDLWGFAGFLTGGLALALTLMQIHRNERLMDVDGWSILPTRTRKNNDGQCREITLTFSLRGPNDAHNVIPKVWGDGVTIMEATNATYLSKNTDPYKIRVFYDKDTPSYVGIGFTRTSAILGRQIQDAVRVRVDTEPASEFATWRWNHIFRGFGKVSRGKWIIAKDRRLARHTVPSDQSGGSKK